MIYTAALCTRLMYWPVVVFFTLKSTFFHIVSAATSYRYTPRNNQPEFSIDNKVLRKSNKTSSSNYKNYKNKCEFWKVAEALLDQDLAETVVLAWFTRVYVNEWIKCDGDVTNSYVKYSYCVVLVINFLRTFRALRIFNDFRTTYIMVVNTLRNIVPMLVLMIMTACFFVFTTRVTNDIKTFRVLFFE